MNSRLPSVPENSTAWLEDTIPWPTSGVMDVLPWPNGYGFTGHEIWWRYVHSQSERERLDHLIGLALLDKTVSERLVTERDPGLFTAFHLSEPTQHWLMNTSAVTLKELAQAIVGVGRLAASGSGKIRA